MEYDVIIIGAGPSGLTAGIFTCRAGLKTICFESLAIGGQASLSYSIANYPGFENITGVDLATKMYNQAIKLGLQINYEKVVSLTKSARKFEITTTKQKYTAKKVIIASGAKARNLGISNEKQFIGKGISYCASCDGNFFKNKQVAIIGGGDTAMENAEYLSKLAKKIYILNRSKIFRAKPYRLAEVKKLKNVEILTNAKLNNVYGKDSVEEIEITHNGEIKNLKLSGVFVAIGHEPDLDFINLNVKTDKNGYILVNQNQQTNIKNLFACGDVVSKNFKQIITACADGAKAGNSCI